MKLPLNTKYNFFIISCPIDIAVKNLFDMTKTQFVDSILNDKNCRFYSRIVLSTQTRNQHSGRSMTFCEIHAPIFVKRGLPEEEKKMSPNQSVGHRNRHADHRHNKARHRNNNFFGNYLSIFQKNTFPKKARQIFGSKMTAPPLEKLKKSSDLVGGCFPKGRPYKKKWENEVTMISGGPPLRSYF